MIIKLIYVLKKFFKSLWLKIASRFKKRVKPSGGIEQSEVLASKKIPMDTDRFGNEYGIKDNSLVKFKLAEGQTHAVIPEGVTSIEYGVFSFCHGLTSVVIPDTVIIIDKWAFHTAQL
ncbi:leucine-rich repeat domain-containing protein [Candidatus Comchoanobacter bicostacola]|uniref:Leucine-rich repeat domain-containing protein n=1 Tax=Candidatus Comchoanobacter bicostacola TaxID=2919598 RepID=A0ABY5DJZ4_9GAMM|nr:leucine-rich repeat domain-containing protein [Candidatus Comchoanobacter bicostacola]UTC24130.1 leucine-rich repeat domain-containing protein [Candidatus Comchoanobacter bicostacola]